MFCHGCLGQHSTNPTIRFALTKVLDLYAMPLDRTSLGPPWLEQHHCNPSFLPCLHLWKTQVAFEERLDVINNSPSYQYVNISHSHQRVSFHCCVPYNLHFQVHFWHYMTRVVLVYNFYSYFIFCKLVFCNCNFKVPLAGFCIILSYKRNLKQTKNTHFQRKRIHYADCRTSYLLFA